jgi:hypothetical protein
MRIARWFVALALAAGSPALVAAQKVAAPTGVSVACNASTFTVSWNNMANVGQYQVNQREGTTVRTLGSKPASPFTMSPCPTAGTAYEYQVVSIGKGAKNTAASPWIAYTVPVAMPTATGPVPTGGIPLDPTKPVSPSTIPAGPTSLTASSSIPGQINLGWREVANATAYRVTRSSNVPEAEQQIAQYTSTSQLAEGGFWYHKDAPVDIIPTYSYKVYALFGTTVSTPSPTALAASAPFYQPTGLKYTVAVSTTKIGTLNVTLSWNAVTNAEKYAITGTSPFGQASVVTPATSYVFPNVPPKTTVTGVCVSTIYPYGVGLDQNKPCIDIKL